MKKLLLCMLIAWSVEARAQSYDFSMSASGPTHVVAGHAIWIELELALTSGTRSYVEHSVSGLPEGATVSYPDLDLFCCGGSLAWDPSNTALRIAVPSSALGAYPLVLTATSDGLVKTVNYTLVVEPEPTPLVGNPTSFPGIPSLAQWEANMTFYGQRHCSMSLDGTYYDAQRVYLGIAEYTQSSTWHACATNAESAYRDGYVLPNGGVVPGYWIFTTGLRRDFELTGDSISRDAVQSLATNALLARQSTPWQYIISASLSRETAYSVIAYIDAEKLGFLRNPRLDDSIEIILGHFDQWFVSQSFRCGVECEPASVGKFYIQPFMVGLSMEALIRYYEEINPDPRIPVTVKLALDWMQAHAFHAPTNAFWYENWIADPMDIPSGYWTPANGAMGSPDLNMIIAPAYAWMYTKTGDTTYRDQGDGAFQGSVAGAWLDGPKQFNQSYRWAFEFVKWRSGTNPPGDTQAPTITLNPPVIDGKNNVTLDAFAADNVGVTRVEFFLDSVLKDTDTVAPYGTTFKLTGPPGQQHTVFARAYDAAGNAGTSQTFIISKN